MKNIFILLVLIFGISFASSAQSKAKKKSKPKATTQYASLAGTGSQARQNRRADKEDLTRIRNDKHLRWMVAHQLMVPIWKGVTIETKKRYAFVRPRVNRFFKGVTYDFHAEFYAQIKNKKRFITTSAVRPLTYQIALRTTNGNAAKDDTGPLASSHPTGATIDITKRNLTPNEIAWMQKYLLRYESLGMLEATEERVQPCFHIMVFNNWKRIPPPQKTKPKITTPKKPTINIVAKIKG